MASQIEPTMNLISVDEDLQEVTVSMEELRSYQEKLKLSAFQEGLEEGLSTIQQAWYKKEKNDPRWAPVRIRGWKTCKEAAVEAITSRIEESKKGNV